MKPIRIQRSRKHKQVSPNGLPIVYVGRPTKFGNPFLVSELGAKEAVLRYRECILNNAMVYLWIDEIQASIEFDRFKWMSENIKTLQGKNLACFCSLSCECHADILLSIANN